MNKYKQIGILVFILVCFASCSLQKRHYMSGYHVSSYKKKHTVTKSSESKKAEVKKSYSANDESLVASSDKGILLPESKKLSLFNTKEECDLIVLKNADEVKVKVVEITETEIKYRKCEEPNGVIYTYKKSDVFMIKYPNGTKEMIKAPVEINTNNTDVYESVPQEKAVKEKKERPQKPKEAKKKVSAFSLIGFILSMVNFFVFFLSIFIYGLFFGSAIIGLAAVILSIIGLVKIKKNPDKYKGKSFSVLGIIFGLILFALALMLSLILLGLI
ncbi:MAG: hypothetical protein KA163_07755 [Bacteroidia bacterium]|nr:hypothetical protein [Bacteroidia bacterium]